jgi:predicted Zn-dependent protease
MRVAGAYRNPTADDCLVNIRRGEFSHLRQVLLAACLAPLVSFVATAQAKGPSATPILTQQLHQALRLVQQGDAQGAMKLTLSLLEQNPRFVPALKLKGMLLEESGQSSEAAASYEEALKFAPNDPDLLLKSGIQKLATGDREEAIRRLQHCTRLLPGDGDAQYYLAQAYHLDGQDRLALLAIGRASKLSLTVHLCCKNMENCCVLLETVKADCGRCSRLSNLRPLCRASISILQSPTSS